MGLELTLARTAEPSGKARRRAFFFALAAKTGDSSRRLACTVFLFFRPATVASQ